MVHATDLLSTDPCHFHLEAANTATATEKGNVRQGMRCVRQGAPIPQQRMIAALCMRNSAVQVVRVSCTQNGV